jgi:hypothetical protein
MDLWEHESFTDEARPHDRGALSSQVAENKSIPLQKKEGLRVAEASVEDLSKLLILNSGQRGD